MRRVHGAAVLAVTAVLMAGLAGIQPAQADPVYPSADQVKKARAHAAQALDDVRQIQQQLDDSAARVEAADIALSSAAEDYDAAAVELDQARAAAAVATAAAKKAGARLDGAQRSVGQLAAQTYRSGGALASLDVLFSPDGPDQVLERATMMQSLAQGQQRTVRKMDDARVVATTLDRQAAHAVEVQDAAAAKLKAAQAVAQSKADAAHNELIAQTALRTRLVAELAMARRTSVSVEQARQRGLAAEAERRREAAEAAAQRLARARAQQAADDGDNGNSGNGNSGGGSPHGPSTDPGGSSSGSASGGDSAVDWARSKVGLPYQWAAAGPGSYDCSGLTMRAWEHAGVSLPHSSRMQYSQTEHVSYGSLRRGDLVFYATDPSRPSTIHHVALYAGDGMMVEAPYTGANVRVVPLRRGDSMPYAGRP